MIVVLDTNIWVSAFLVPRSIPGRLLSLAQTGTLRVVSSAHLWSELHRAVTYERVRTVLERDGLWREVLGYLDEHSDVSFVHDVSPAENWLPDDPDDNWVIQCALTARAERIVTGDRKLRGLAEIAGIRIASARELLQELGLESK